MIISGAEPFFLQGSSHGVLLIHGFTGNPAELLLLGQHLQSQNFTVLGVRLAGHGTNEEDFAHTTKDDWINSALDGYFFLKGCCDTISVIGHSMGGLIALKLATVTSINIQRLVTLAAPILINDERGLQFLPPREQCLNLKIDNTRRKLKNVPAAVNRVYRSIPLISVHELVDLLNDVKENLNKIKIPILIMHGTEDHTADVKSADYIYEHIASQHKQVELMEDMGHLLPLIAGRDKVFELTAKFLWNGRSE